MSRKMSRNSDIVYNSDRGGLTIMAKKKVRVVECPKCKGRGAVAEEQVREEERKRDRESEWPHYTLR